MKGTRPYEAHAKNLAVTDECYVTACLYLLE